MGFGPLGKTSAMFRVKSMIRLFLYGILLLSPLLAACSNPMGLMTQVFLSPVSIATSTYASAVDERGIGCQMDDAAIRSAIRARVQAEAFLDGVNVSIYSYEGNVFLMGDVSPRTRGIAVDAARQTGGVRRVVTHWFLRESGDLAGDLTIGARLRAEMIADIYLSSTQIDTYTCGGNVLLLGMVRSRGDESRALEVARAISGVRSVKSYLIF